MSPPPASRMPDLRAIASVVDRPAVERRGQGTAGEEGSSGNRHSAGLMRLIQHDDAVGAFTGPGAPVKESAPFDGVAAHHQPRGNNGDTIRAAHNILGAAVDDVPPVICPCLLVGNPPGGRDAKLLGQLGLPLFAEGRGREYKRGTILPAVTNAAVASDSVLPTPTSSASNRRTLP